MIGALYFAKAVFVPLALAILLTFLLAPAVRLLRSWGLPKPPAVVLVVAFAFAVILGIGALVGQQVTKLAQNLPLYQYNIEEKIRSARGFAGGGMLERIYFLRRLPDARNIQSYSTPVLPTESRPRIERAESVFFATGVSVAHGGNRSCYVPTTDTVHMPCIEFFREGST